MSSWQPGLSYGMFKDGQLVLLPQHMWEENQEGGRQRYVWKLKKRESERERKQFLIQTFVLTFDPLRGGKRAGNILWEINGEETNTSLDASCLDGKQSLPPVKTHRPTQREIKKARRDKRARDKERKKKGGRSEEIQSETVIRLQSVLLSDLFRILNRESRSTKTKDETIIR